MLCELADVLCKSSEQWSAASGPKPVGIAKVPGDLQECARRRLKGSA